MLELVELLFAFPQPPDQNPIISEVEDSVLSSEHPAEVGAEGELDVFRALRESPNIRNLGRTAAGDRDRSAQGRRSHDAFSHHATRAILTAKMPCDYAR